MTTPLLTAVLTGIFLCLIQLVLALPWLAALDSQAFKANVRTPGVWLKSLAGVAGAGLLLGIFLAVRRDPDAMTATGRIFGSVMHAQLIADLLVLFFTVLLTVWPKGGAVAVSSFREGLRQPMFWFFTVGALAVLFLLPVIPYFTFGEDLKMVKDLGFSITMLSAAAFGVLAASMSISEEIEGRTAITLMSKPVSRRQFLIGKFLGILCAGFAMTGMLSWVFNWVVLVQPHFESMADPVLPPPWVEQATQAFGFLGPAPAFFLRGMFWWLGDAGAAVPGIILGFCQAMVLIAIAVALATRLPMIVNVVSCVVIFFLGHLTPLLAQVSQDKLPLVRFMAQLFDTVLPGLDFFDLGPTIVRDVPPAPGPFAFYVASVALYAVLYTAISLLFGLILFEDRDLA